MQESGFPTDDRPARRLVILAEGQLGVFSAKTAVCLLRYCADEVVCVLDSTRAGSSTADHLPLAVDRPIVGSLAEAARHHPDTLVIGIAPRGGELPEAWRALVLEAIERGWSVQNGLHVFLRDDVEIAARAGAQGVELVDLRQPPARWRLPRERAAEDGTRPHVLLTVGSDCNVGKMTAAVEIVRAAGRRGVRAHFAATGQTGILIAGRGVAIDRVISDFVAGAAEELVDDHRDADWVVVEGQGSLLHPAYSGVTLGLLHGVRPDALVICHHVGRTRIDGYDVPLPGPGALVRLYETAAAWVQPAPVVGFALNGVGVEPGVLADYATRVEREAGVPAVDPLTDAGRLVEAVLARRAPGGF